MRKPAAGERTEGHDSAGPEQGDLRGDHEGDRGHHRTDRYIFCGGGDQA